jgi:hypothetical protein
VKDPGAPRWRGQSHRLEVWYATATDAATGTGLWIHDELVAPSAAEAYRHGWIAGFPPDSAPWVQRFGPEPAARPAAGDVAWQSGGDVTTAPGRLVGSAGEASWDLAVGSSERPIWTMTRTMWEREALPSAHVVVAPRASIRGHVVGTGGSLDFEGIGAVSHIYGHGNAQRWGWLHADLDDDTTIELVAAVGRRPALRRLRPIGFVQLRRRGHPDWPANPMLAAPLFRSSLRSPTWTVRGAVGRQRLSVTVGQPEDRCVRLDYTDPDGAAALCTNTERADVVVRLDVLTPRGWRTDAEWSLRGTAHSELGTRAG